MAKIDYGHLYLKEIDLSFNQLHYLGWRLNMLKKLLVCCIFNYESTIANDISHHFDMQIQAYTNENLRVYDFQALGFKDRVTLRWLNLI